MRTKGKSVFKSLGEISGLSSLWWWTASQFGVLLLHSVLSSAVTFWRGHWVQRSSEEAEGHRIVNSWRVIYACGEKGSLLLSCGRLSGGSKRWSGQGLNNTHLPLASSTSAGWYHGLPAGLTPTGLFKCLSSRKTLSFHDPYLSLLTWRQWDHHEEE